MLSASRRVIVPTRRPGVQAIRAVRVPGCRIPEPDIASVGSAEALIFRLQAIRSFPFRPSASFHGVRTVASNATGVDSTRPRRRRIRGIRPTCGRCRATACDTGIGAFPETAAGAAARRASGESVKTARFVPAGSKNEHTDGDSGEDDFKP